MEKIVIFKIINETGDVVTSIAPNVNYYIKIYSLYDGSNEDAPISFDFSGFTLEAYSTYYLSNANFLSTGSGNDQAVIEINKESNKLLSYIGKLRNSISEKLQQKLEYKNNRDILKV